MFIPHLTSYLTHQRGAVFLLFTTVFLPLVLIGAALAINVSTIQVQKTQLQNAADAAALAGINGVQNDIRNNINFTIKDNYEDITTKIIDYFVIKNNSNISLNLGSSTQPNSNYTDYTVNNWSSDQNIDTSFPSQTGIINMAVRYATTKTGKTVQVDLRRKVHLYLFGLNVLPYNWTSINIAARATAKYEKSQTSSGAAFFAGSTDDDSIQAWSSGINIEGDVGTNGRVKLSNPNIVTLSNGNITGNNVTKNAGKTIWSVQDWKGDDLTFGGTYSTNYEDAIDVNYKTSSNQAIANMGSFINQVINNSNSKYSVDNYYTQIIPANNGIKKLWWANDGNWYKKGDSDTLDNSSYPTNHATVKGTPTTGGWDITEPNPVQSTGPQIYYIPNSTNSSSTLTVNINTVTQNGVTFNNDGVNKAMWTTGADKYGYNVVIANGSINATTNVNNTVDNPMILISLNGDVSLHLDTQSYYGMVYAPNGKITFDGNNSNASFYGSAIGNKLLFSKNNQSFIYTSFDGIGGDDVSKTVFSTFSSFYNSTGSSSGGTIIKLIPNDAYNQ